MTTKASLTIRANQKKRTFTIKKRYTPGNFIVTFRTVEFTLFEFKEMQFNTLEDWDNFLQKNILSYYLVKKKFKINN